MRTGSGRGAGDDVVGRRLLLAGGVRALTAPLAVHAPSTQAASGDPVLLGRDNRATSVTTVRNVHDGGVGLRVRSAVSRRWACRPRARTSPCQERASRASAYW